MNVTLMDHMTLIARVAHEVNRAYCLAIGDESQKPWDEAPDWQKKSAVNGVLFHIGNPDAGPESSHENWLSEKTHDGWVYGAVKDPKAKTHPCILPFRLLPVEQQIKDHLFKAVCNTMSEVG